MARLLFALGLVEVSSEDGLGDADDAEDADAEADVLPGEAAALVEAPGAVAEEAGERDDACDVGEGEGAGGVVGEGGELAGEPGVGAAGLCGGLLLGEVGFGAGLLLAVDAGGLGVGLDVLLEEVGGDGADGFRVDVDEGRGRGGGVGDDLGRLGGGGLEDVMSVSCEMRRWCFGCGDGGMSNVEGGNGLHPQQTAWGPWRRRRPRIQTL